MIYRHEPQPGEFVYMEYCGVNLWKLAFFSIWMDRIKALEKSSKVVLRLTLRPYPEITPC